MAGPHGGTYDGGRAVHSGRETDTFQAEQLKLVLDALRWHWGEAYEISFAGGEFTAARLDGEGKPLRTSSADELRDVILADYTAKPVPRDLPLAEPVPGEPLG